jgi:hypothetical protein
VTQYTAIRVDLVANIKTGPSAGSNSSRGLGMEELIKQTFLHVDVIGPHVHEGHYDLVGPDREIILPQVWETMVQPDWTITMHMWPMPEPESTTKDGVQVAVKPSRGRVLLDRMFERRRPFLP